MARLTTPPRPELRWRQTVSDHVIALGWSPDGNTLAAASVAGPVTLFDITTGAVRYELVGHGFGTTAVSWHPDGKSIATAGQDGKVRLWDTATGQERAALDAGAAWVEHAAWGPKGDYLVSAAGKKLRLWKADGTLDRAYPDHAATVSDVAWSPRGKEFAVSGYGGVTVIRPDATEPPTTTFPWKSSILSVAWSPDGAMLAGGAQDASVHFWYVKSGEDLQMSGYPTKVRELAWDSKSRFLATGGGEMLIVWDCSGKGRPVGTAGLRAARTADLGARVSAAWAGRCLGLRRWAAWLLVPRGVEEDTRHGRARGGRQPGRLVPGRRPIGRGRRDRGSHDVDRVNRTHPGLPWLARLTSTNSVTLAWSNSRARAAPPLRSFTIISSSYTGTIE